MAENETRKAALDALRAEVGPVDMGRILAALPPNAGVVEAEWMELLESFGQHDVFDPREVCWQEVPWTHLSVGYAWLEGDEPNGPPSLVSVRDDGGEGSTSLYCTHEGLTY